MKCFNKEFKELIIEMESNPLEKCGAWKDQARYDQGMDRTKWSFNGHTPLELLKKQINKCY
jgi:hypothetical protein